MTKIKGLRLPRRSTAFKYCRFSSLSPTFWRNKHMSRNGSPIPELSFQRRNRTINGISMYFSRKETPRSNPENSVQKNPMKLMTTVKNSEPQMEQDEALISDDEMEYVMFPVVSNVRSEVQSDQPLSSSPSRKYVEGRRPLHDAASDSQDEVAEVTDFSPRKSSPNKIRHSTSPREKSAPYQSPKGKQSSRSVHETSGELLDVEFIGEMSPNDSLLSTPERNTRQNSIEEPSTSKLPSRTTKYSKAECSESNKIQMLMTSEHKPVVKSPAKKLHITLRLKSDDNNLSKDNRIVRYGTSVNNETVSTRRNKNFLRENRDFGTETDFETNDDDLVVIQSEENGEENIDLPTLKRTVISVVSHFAEENNLKHLSLEYVLTRLKALYHKDFSHRTKDIKCFIRRAVERCKSQKRHKEVRPGVRTSDIATLSSANWLNDIIINQYMSMLVKDKPKFGAISSFWYEELLKGKEPSLPEHWENMRSILAPTCVDAHWSLLCYSPRDNSVEIYSSLPVSSVEVQCGQTLLELFSNKLLRKVEGQCLAASGLPHQGNEHDCGVYVCMFARCIVCGNSFDIVPQHVHEFRVWLEKEIVAGKLFGD